MSTSAAELEWTWDALRAEWYCYDARTDTYTFGDGRQVKGQNSGVYRAREQAAWTWDPNNKKWYCYSVEEGMFVWQDGTRFNGFVSQR